MTKVIIAVAILVVLAILVRLLDLFTKGRTFASKSQYQYSRKDFIMTRAEHECYDTLVAEMGASYYFFPQIHLNAIVQPIDARKNRLYAFRHINQKSVDFVACDKKTIRPLFAIELDDKTHNRIERIDRDKEVERILQGAGIPLIRIKNRGFFEKNELSQLVQKGIETSLRFPDGMPDSAKKF